MKRDAAIAALKGLLEEGRDCSVAIRGTSMHPFLEAGDRVHLQAVEVSRLRVGDLIAFRQDGRLVVHRYAGRVARAGACRLRQKGDNLRGHGEIPAEALVGRAVWAERGTQRRNFLQGRGLASNRLRGAWAWACCSGMAAALWTRGQLRSRAGTGKTGQGPAQAGPPAEAELLSLAARLELAPAQEARLSVLLGQAPRWDHLLEQAGQFGMVPLLHHHLSRPALAAQVPPEAREALAAGYFRTSLENLRILGLLRRFLLKAREAGIEVILLKGAFLARWLYADVGLRPMKDLDLLCRKRDEPAIQGIMEAMGGSRSDRPAGPGPGLGALRTAVQEKLGHAAPWQFPDICRIELHYHLLSQATPDDGWLLEDLWAGAEDHDWDGLRVRSLGPAHLALHLASHLDHHLQEGGFNLYWLADIRELFRRRRTELRGPVLPALARRLGLEPGCARVARLAGEPWDGAGPGLDEAEAARALAALMERAMRARGAEPRTVSGCLAIIRDIRHVPGWLDKARYLKQVFLPPAWFLARKYGTANRCLLPLLYLLHPFSRLFLGLRGSVQHVQRRLGH